MQQKLQLNSSAVPDKEGRGMRETAKEGGDLRLTDEWKAVGCWRREPTGQVARKVLESSQVFKTKGLRLWMRAIANTNCIKG